MGELPTFALSVRQPWAWLIVNGHKDIENRTWAPFDGRIGQRIWIHAGKTAPKADYVAELQEWLDEAGSGIAIPSELFLGGVVGSAVLAEVGTYPDNMWYVDEDEVVGWRLEDPEPLLRPVLCRGQLGLWRPGPDVRELLEAAAA